MTATLRPVSESEAQRAAFVSLGLEGGASPADIRIELLRALAWALTGGARPVHIVRLLNRAIDLATNLGGTGLEPEFLREVLRSELQSLAAAGDLAELDSGLWLPAPTRLVEVGEGVEFSLLVGGIPSRMLAEAVRIDVSRNGPFRLLKRRAAALLSYPLEPLSEWARKPNEPLDAWGRYLLDSDIPEFTETQDGAKLELYLPARANRGAPQFKRWYERYEDAKGRFIARRIRVYGAREYRIVEVDRKRVTRSGAILTRHEARRLMYAVDSAANNPTRAKWMARGEGGDLVLTSELPESERRIFGAMGVFEPNPERVYERRWTFSAHGRQILDTLRDLHIDVQLLAQPGGTSR